MLLLHHKQILKWGKLERHQVLNPLTSCSYLADDLSMTPLQSSHLSHFLSETSLRLPPLVSHSESLIWQNIQVNAWLKFEMPKTINRIKRSTFFSTLYNYFFQESVPSKRQFPTQEHGSFSMIVAKGWTCWKYGLYFSIVIVCNHVDIMEPWRVTIFIYRFSHQKKNMILPLKLTPEKWRLEVGRLRSTFFFKMVWRNWISRVTWIFTSRQIAHGRDRLWRFHGAIWR